MREKVPILVMLKSEGREFVLAFVCLQNGSRELERRKGVLTE
jgi:hypothetical protein